MYLGRQLVEMPDKRILRPIRQSLGRYILGLPIHSLRLVSLLIVKVHPHFQRDDQSKCQGFYTDGDSQWFAVRRCLFCEGKCWWRRYRLYSPGRLTTCRSACLSQAMRSSGIRLTVGPSAERSTVFICIIPLVPRMKQYGRGKRSSGDQECCKVPCAHLTNG